MALPFQVLSHLANYLSNIVSCGTLLESLVPMVVQSVMETIALETSCLMLIKLGLELDRVLCSLRHARIIFINYFAETIKESIPRYVQGLHLQIILNTSPHIIVHV